MRRILCALAALLLPVVVVCAQQQVSQTATVPHLIKFSGTIAGARDAASLTFSVYGEQEGGSPLWSETQDVALDQQGSYTIYLGANHADGIPDELFASGEARWLEVVSEGQPPQPRVLLVSVPYAIKAGDAGTLGGLPASAYMLASENPSARPADEKASSGEILQQASGGKAVPPRAVVTAGPTNFSGSNTNQIVSVKQSGSGDALSASSNANSATVYAENSATAGKSAQGVLGVSKSTQGYGVHGDAAYIGVYGTSESSAGEGVVGLESSKSGSTFGVYGAVDSTSRNSAGVIGEAIDGDGLYGFSENLYGVVALSAGSDALWAQNNSSTIHTAHFVNANSSGPSFITENVSGKGCEVDGNGNLLCSGSKSAVVPIDGGQRKVALYAVESPQNWFEDFGSEQLIRGVAVVRLDPEFAQTVNSAFEYHVFLTPEGDCKGLYVTNKTAVSFEVRELGGGAANVRFDYRIVALRKNFENIRLQDHTHDFDVVQTLPVPSRP